MGERQTRVTVVIGTTRRLGASVVVVTLHQRYQIPARMLWESVPYLTVGATTIDLVRSVWA
jgi:hypothetical protein